MVYLLKNEYNMKKNIYKNIYIYIFGLIYVIQPQQ